MTQSLVGVRGVFTNGSLAAGGVTVNMEAVRIGDTLVLCVGLNSSAVSVSSVSGGAGTWTLATRQTSNSTSVEIWTGSNPISDATSVSVTLSGTTDVGAAVVIETGSTGVLDTARGVADNGQAGSTTTSPVANIATQWPEVAVAVVAAQTTSGTFNGLGISYANWDRGTSPISDGTGFEIYLSSTFLVGVQIEMDDPTMIGANWQFTTISGTYDAASAIASHLPSVAQMGKMYLRSATTTVPGILPAAGVSLSASTPTVIATGGGTNRSMSASKGAVQTSQALTTLAQTASQSGLIGRWVSPRIAGCRLPYVGQGFGSASTTLFGLDVSYSESNTNSAFNVASVLAIWDPGRGVLVNLLGDLVGTLNTGVTGEINTFAANGNVEVNMGFGSALGTQISDGDVFILELWRVAGTQGMSTAYTNSVFYEGTTERSTTSEAAYIVPQISLPLFTDPVREARDYSRQALKRSSIR